MQVHKTLVSPTTVTHSLTCRLTGEDNTLVVVRGSSLLQLYKTVSVNASLFSSTDAQNDDKVVDLSGSEDLENVAGQVKPSSDSISGSANTNSRFVAESTAATENAIAEKENKLEDAASAEDAFLLDQDTFIGSETALIEEYPNVVPSISDSADTATVKKMSEKLVFVREWPLQGQIIGIQKIQTSITPHGFDSLLVAFTHAKISLVSWDPLTYSFKIHSLHYYEKSLQDSLFVDTMFLPKFDVDPNSKAATLMFQPDTMAFLPFVQDELLDETIINTNNNAATGATNNANPPEKQLPPIYKSSFIINGVSLNESIENILDFSYLKSYREPAIAVLYQPTRTWACRVQLERDTVCYMVLSIDFTQRTFTPIVSAKSLPYTLSKVVPLANPLGGSLLIGSNEFVHVDSQGRVNGVIVNPLHKISSNLELKDQKDLNLVLDGCVVSQLDDAPDEVFVVLQNGQYLSVKFFIESRKVQELTVKEIPTVRQLQLPIPTTISTLKSRYMFVGSATSDAKLIQWKREGETEGAAVQEPEPEIESEPQSKKSKVTKDDENLYDELDDIYGDLEADDKVKTTIVNSNTVDNRPIDIRLSDKLPNYGPVNDMVICRSKNIDCDDGDYYDLVGATGSGIDGHLTVFNRKLRPSVVSKLKLKNNFSRIWALSPSVLPPAVDAENDTNDPANGAEEGFLGENIDTYLIGSNSKATFIFKIGDEFEDVTKSIPNFKLDAPTLAATTVLDGRLIAQVCSNVVVVYDSDMTFLTKKALKQEPKSVSFANNHIMLNYDADSSNEPVKTETIAESQKEEPKLDTKGSTSLKKVSMLSIHQKKGEPGSWDILESPLPSTLPESLALFGGVSQIFASCKSKNDGSDSTSLKRKRDQKPEPQNSSTDTGPAPIAYTLSESELFVFLVNSCNTRFDLSKLLQLPNVLSLSGTTFVEDESTMPPQAPSHQPQLAKIVQISHFVLENEIEKHNECIALLTSTNEIYIYRLMVDPKTQKLMVYKLRNSLKMTHLNQSEGEDESKPSEIPTKLVPYENIGGFSGLFVLGKTPTMIMKQVNSAIQFHSLASTYPVLGFTSFNTPSVNRGLAYIDAEYMLRISTLPEHTDLGTAWPTQKLFIDDGKTDASVVYVTKSNPVETIVSMSYHDSGDVLAVATVYPDADGYQANDPEGNPIPDLNLEMPRPDSYRSKLKLVSPLTWTVIDQVEYDVNESVMTLKSVLLEVSEKTKQQKEFLVVGTSIIRGEDLAAMGGFYIYEVIDVVPEPGRPETNRKLKQVTSEVGKGAVTSVCEVSGHLLIAQAQKVVIRNMQEDLSIVPVAFMDMNMYVLSAKSLKYMVLVADAIRSVWLVGFGQEPYRMTLFAKDYRDIQVTSCDFAVVQKKLFIAVADTQQRIHILQYDPEDPMPFSGQKLIRRAEFFTGKDIDTMVMLQYNDPVDHTQTDQRPEPPKQAVYVPLCGARDGSLSVIVPVSESVYRPLYVVQQQLADKEEHYLGLNPRMHRTTGVAPVATSSQNKAVIDFDLVRTFQDLPIEKRSQYARRLGKMGEYNVWKSMIYVDEALKYL